MYDSIQNKFIKAVAFSIFACAALSADPYYWGNDQTNCATCHSAVVGTWSQTAHAMAYDSLVAIPTFGYSCLECHTTGWDTGVMNYGADEYVAEGADDSYTLTDEANFNRVKNIQCEMCHGPGLRGKGNVPTIAGRSPSYIVRQLYDFRSGSRNGPDAQLMKPVTARLKMDDMISLAAYLASLHP